MNRFRYSLSLVFALAALLVAEPGPAAEPDTSPDWSAAGQRAIEQLQQYVRIPTVNPPGETTQAVAWLAEQFTEFGVTSQTVGADPLKPAFLATLPGREKGGALLLLHHMDVVPAAGQTWTVPPFEGRVTDGSIWGRGTLDTKGLGVIMLGALRELKKGGIQPQQTIYYVGIPDEEVQGAAGAAWFVENILPKLGSVAYVVNEGGFGMVGVLDDHTVNMTVQVAEKKPLWLHVKARGKSGHGSAPHGDNAADKLVRALDRLQHSQLGSGIPPVVAEMLRRTSILQPWPSSSFARHADTWPFRPMVIGSLKGKSPHTNAMTHNTCTLTEFSGGIKSNVIPPEVQATLDCRLLPGEEFEDFKVRLLEIFDESDLSLEVVLQSESGPASDWNTPLFRAIENATLRHYPGAIVSPMMSAGYTDSAYFRRKGIVSYGFNPTVISPEIMSSMHNVDERLPVEPFKKAIPIFYEVLRAFAEGL